MLIRIKTKYLLLGVIILAGCIILLIILNHILTQKSPSYASTKRVVTPVPPRPTTAIGNTKEYNHIRDIADSQGLQAAWQYVIDTYATNSAQPEIGHDYAHYVGQLIFDRKGIDGMAICTTDLAFGCYHGLLDYAFRKDLSSLPKAEQACRKVGQPSTGPYDSCIHGIGHGVASYFRDKDLLSALKTCDKLPEGAPQYCYDGVFMEFSRDALDAFYHQDNPMYPCNAIDDKYAYACARNQPDVLLSRFHKSFTDIAKLCVAEKSVNIRTACFISLGFHSVYNQKGDPQKIISQCQSINDADFQYQCTSAAAGELIFQNMPGWQNNSPIICNSLKDSSQTTMCLGYIENIKENYHRQ